MTPRSGSESGLVPWLIESFGCPCDTCEMYHDVTVVFVPGWDHADQDPEIGPCLQAWDSSTAGISPSSKSLSCCVISPG